MPAIAKKGILYTETPSVENRVVEGNQNPVTSGAVYKELGDTSVNNDLGANISNQIGNLHTQIGRLTQVQSQIVPTASIESGDTASKAYSKGDFLVKNGVLYKVTNAIAEGDALTVGTNIDSTTVVDELSEIKPSVQLSLDAVAVGKDEDGNTIYEKTFKGSTISSGTVLDSTLTISNIKWLRLVGGCFNNGEALIVLPYDTGSNPRYNFMVSSNSKGLVVIHFSVTVKMYHFTVQYVLK